MSLYNLGAKTEWGIGNSRLSNMLLGVEKKDFFLRLMARLEPIVSSFAIRARATRIIGGPEPEHPLRPALTCLRLPVDRKAGERDPGKPLGNMIVRIADAAP